MIGSRRTAGAACLGLVVGALAAGCAFAQGGPVVYPAGGQSSEQVQRDKNECRAWAANETGVDPSRTPPPSGGTYATAPSGGSSSGFLGVGGDRNAVGGQGSVLSDAATGAALGAIGGAIAGNAGKGAGIGALAATIFGGISRSSRADEEARWRAQQEAQMRAQQQQARNAYGQSMAQYNKAYSLCMSSRNYRVQ